MSALSGFLGAICLLLDSGSTVSNKRSQDGRCATQAHKKGSVRGEVEDEVRDRGAAVGGGVVGGRDPDEARGQSKRIQISVAGGLDLLICSAPRRGSGGSELSLRRVRESVEKYDLD